MIPTLPSLLRRPGLEEVQWRCSDIRTPRFGGMTSASMAVAIENAQRLALKLWRKTLSAQDAAVLKKDIREYVSAARPRYSQKRPLSKWFRRRVGVQAQSRSRLEPSSFSTPGLVKRS